MSGVGRLSVSLISLILKESNRNKKGQGSSVAGIKREGKIAGDFI